jgi:hypothetical protein
MKKQRHASASLFLQQMTLAPDFSYRISRFEASKKMPLMRGAQKNTRRVA